MQHPNDQQIAGYARRTLGPVDLLAVDDHLGSCEPCRGRAAALARIDPRSVEDLRDDMLPPESHLSDEQVGAYAGGALGVAERVGVDAHLAACSTCAREVGELEVWARKRPGRLGLWFAATAAVLFIGLGVGLVLWRSGSFGKPARDASLAAIESLPDLDRQQVQAALEAGVAEPPAYLADLGGAAEALMGAAPAGGFRLVAPLATAVISDRPTFRWESVAGAARYTVSVADEELHPVARSSRIAETTWTPEQPLARGRTYVWQVSAERGGESVRAPAPPAPLAKFRIVDEGPARRLEAISSSHPDAHLVLGVLYAQAGMSAEAERHLAQVPPTDPHFDVARRTRGLLGHAATPVDRQ
jgi:hypothetical protein